MRSVKIKPSLHFEDRGQKLEITTLTSIPQVHQLHVRLELVD